MNRIACTSPRNTIATPSKTTPKHPKYTEYPSVENFFNCARRQLIREHWKGPFLDRLVLHPGIAVSGYLKEPPPPPKARSPLTAEDIAREKKRKHNNNKKDRTLLDPQWCLQRRWLMEMWNRSLHQKGNTKEAWKDSKRARVKMRPLLKEFKLHRLHDGGGLRAIPIRQEL